MNSAVIVAIVIIACIALYYFIRKQKLVKKVKNKEEYKVPLSDDVQQIYYDNFEKKQAEKENSSETSDTDNQDSAS